MIATAQLEATGSGYAIALYIFGCAIVSIVATALQTNAKAQDLVRDHI